MTLSHFPKLQLYWARLHVKLYALNAKIEARHEYLNSSPPPGNSYERLQGKHLASKTREHQTETVAEDATLCQLTAQRNKLETQIDVHRKCSQEMRDFRGVNKFIRAMLGN